MSKTLLRTAAAVVLGLAATASFAAPGDMSVIIKNKSEWIFTELYLSSVDDSEWGPDQLGRDVINPGESFTLQGVSCDAYDVRLVDEDDDVCILNNVVLCKDDAEWVVTNKELLSCQSDTDE